MSRVRIPSIAPFLQEEKLNYLQALILGMVQGLTEFFPISSSAHLRMAKWLLGVPGGENTLYFDLVCHGGTLFALLIYLRHELKIFREWRAVMFFSLALVPLVPAYFLLKPLRLIASQPCYLGYSLMFTALLLFAASRRAPLTPVPVRSGTGKSTGTILEIQKYRDVLFIGVMQALALIPGISRSGATIAAARFCGWDWKKGALFSFLLSIPAILGGQLLESIKAWKTPPESIEILPLFLGFSASFGVGLIAVRFIFWIYEKEKVRPFAWYCLGMGLLTWAIFHGKTTI